MALETIHFGTTKDGQEVYQYVLRSPGGIEVRCINYGCRITGICTPDKTGAMGDIVQGYDTVAGYEEDDAYHGAFVGRYANRISGASFTLEGETYSLMQNDGNSFLHGSFSHRVFTAQAMGDNSVSFTYISPDGEDGFPGELWIAVTYTLTDQDELVMDYRAHSNKTTHVNFTNHSYFNLNPGTDSVDGHVLWLGCRQFLETTKELCPTGRVLPVEGGAFDFTTAKPIGQDINKPDPQLQAGGGYDHCFVIDKASPQSLAMCASVTEPVTGRALRVYTTQPAVQFYGGNSLNGRTGKGGVPMPRRSGFCLETQHYPDTPAHPDFPPTVLEAGEKYHSITLLKFE